MSTEEELEKQIKKLQEQKEKLKKEREANELAEKLAKENTEYETLWVIQHGWMADGEQYDGIQLPGLMEVIARHAKEKYLYRLSAKNYNIRLRTETEFGKHVYTLDYTLFKNKQDAINKLLEEFKRTEEEYKLLKSYFDRIKSGEEILFDHA